VKERKIIKKGDKVRVWKKPDKNYEAKRVYTSNWYDNFFEVIDIKENQMGEKVYVLKGKDNKGEMKTFERLRHEFDKPPLDKH